MKNFLIILVLAIPVSVTGGDFALPSAVTSILENTRKAMWSIFVAVGVVMFLYAGILFLSSAGNPEQMAKAKKALIYGVIGAAVGVLAYSAVNIIKTITG